MLLSSSYQTPKQFQSDISKSHTNWYTNVNLHRQRYRTQGGRVHPSLADVYMQCKYDIRILARFDLSAAVMSLVVKLLLSFNAVYRQRHLLAGTVIYPFLRQTHWTLSALVSLLQGSTVTYLIPPVHQLFLQIWSFLYFQWWFKTGAIKISVYGENRIWIIHALRVGWGTRGGFRKMLPSSVFPLSILIRLLIYLFL